MVTSDRYKTEDECVPFATLAARQQLGADRRRDRAGPHQRRSDASSRPAWRRTATAPATRRCKPRCRPARCRTSASPSPPARICSSATSRQPGLQPDPGMRRRDRAAPAARPDTVYGYYPGLPMPVTLTPSPGLCIAYQKDGEPCNDSNDCDPTSFAAGTPEFVCGAADAGRRSRAHPCSNLLTGQVTSNCDASAGPVLRPAFTFTCRHYPARRRAVQSVGPPQCDPDPALALSCDFLFSGTCKPPGNEGDACGGPAIAPAARICLPRHAGRRHRRRAAGAPGARRACTDRCASPARLHHGRLPRTPGTTPIGAACTQRRRVRLALVHRVPVGTLRLRRQRLLAPLRRRRRDGG